MNKRTLTIANNEMIKKVTFFVVVLTISALSEDGDTVYMHGGAEYHQTHVFLPDQLSDFHDLRRMNSTKVWYLGMDFCVNLHRNMKETIYPAFDLNAGYSRNKAGVSGDFIWLWGHVEKEVSINAKNYTISKAFLRGFEIGYLYPFLLIDKGLCNKPSFMAIELSSGLYWYYVETKDNGKKYAGFSPSINCEYKCFFYFPELPNRYFWGNPDNHIPMNLSLAVRYLFVDKERLFDNGLLFAISYGLSIFGFN